MDGGRGRTDEWVGRIRAEYAFARSRHAKMRAQAYALAMDDALEQGLCGAELRITDIDRRALEQWQAAWRGEHPSGAGGWNWPGLVDALPHRAAVLPIALWYGEDLCGMALGIASRRRLNGSRHTVTLTHVERRPTPPDVPLRRQVIRLAVSAARYYGISVGAQRLRLRWPDRRLLPYYQQHGFEIAWNGDTPVHCEREIWP